MTFTQHLTLFYILYILYTIVLISYKLLIISKWLLSHVLGKIDKKRFKFKQNIIFYSRHINITSYIIYINSAYKKSNNEDKMKNEALIH